MLVSWIAAEHPCVTITLVASSPSELTQVVFTVAPAGADAAPLAGRVGLPLFIARCVIARVEIHTRATLLHMGARQLLEEALRLLEERVERAGGRLQSLDFEVPAEVHW